MGKKKASIIVLILVLLTMGMLSLAFNIQSVKSSEVQVGVKSGDWIRYAYVVSGWPSGQPYPEWLKIEFLSVEGTNATVHVTMHMSDGTEQNDTVPITIGGEGQALGLSGFVIPVNLTVGDSVYISGYGNVTIEGETAGTYAGASRTVVYASFSQYGTQLTYYWDKQTGVMVEASSSYSGITSTATATETNMWQTETYTCQTIYIRSNGTIDPSDAPVQRIGDVYTLINNITCSADGIVIERNNTIVEGANHVLLGSGYGNGITITDRDNVTLRNMTIKNFAYGVFVRGSTNNKIIRNNILCSRAVDVEMYVMRYENTSSLIAENKIEYREWGVRFSHISNNVLQENNISCSDPYSSDSTGVKLYCSSSNLITQNRIMNGQQGITLDDSLFNYIDQNIISTSRSWRYGETCGISLESSTLNVISDNNITKNFYGLRITYSYEGYRNAIYHNNFINNTYPAKIENFPDNAWDNGYPFGGNYWSDYNGTDMLSGPFQNETGSDEIGDRPYIIDENNIDKYPLMEPWSPIPTELIYIRADGSIDPADAPIQWEGGIYTFAGNVHGSIVVERDNIVVDGAGFALRGIGKGIGVDLSGRNNVTIKNMEIEAFYTGIMSPGSSNNKFYENKIVNNLYAIQLHQSSNNSLSENSITANLFIGIWLEYSSKNIMSRNNLTNNWYGLVVLSSSNNTVSDNNIIANSYQGVCLYSSSSNAISGNKIAKNNEYGVYLYRASHNTISGNIVSNNKYGISTSHLSNIGIIENVVTNNQRGIWLISSTNNSITGNNVTANTEGIHIQSSSNNIVSKNHVANNGKGIHLSWSSDNKIYHNNFVDNTQQVHIEASDHTNFWDNGYPSGGNYWSNQTGIDLHSGPFQNETKSDGIGDAPYIIDVNNTDRYPLMAPISIFDVGVWNGVAYHVDVASNSSISDFHFNPDKGPFLKFNVTGEEETTGFCRVTIPKDLLWAENGQWNVLVGGEKVNYTIISDENYTYLYFTYNHTTKMVLIQGTDVIPEFPSSMALLGFLMLITIPLIFIKKKQQKTKS